MSEATPTIDGARAVVLVQGAWADGTGWAGVIAPLQEAGEAAITPANPLRDISGTLNELQRVLGSIAKGLRAPEPLPELLAVPDLTVLPAHVDSGSAPAPIPLGLSGREIEVLRLVADGLTNVQIAEQLFISPKTVSTHLGSVFSKLGVTTRAAATRFAIEQGLV
jgi:DNA-binding CsgD family transcriptional regulator